MIHIGFTGTRKGMNRLQEAQFQDYLDNLCCEVIFHHGDCVGADMDAHFLASDSENVLEIHVHPPLNEAMRAFCIGEKMYPPKLYLDRNHDIVDAVDVLLVAPEGGEEMISGTWATVRYARKQKKTIVILEPQ